MQRWSGKFRFGFHPPSKSNWPLTSHWACPKLETNFTSSSSLYFSFWNTKERKKPEVFTAWRLVRLPASAALLPLPFLSSNFGIQTLKIPQKNTYFQGSPQNYASEITFKDDPSRGTAVYRNLLSPESAWPTQFSEIKLCYLSIKFNWPHLCKNLFYFVVVLEHEAQCFKM